MATSTVTASTDRASGLTTVTMTSPEPKVEYILWTGSAAVAVFVLVGVFGIILPESFGPLKDGMFVFSLAIPALIACFGIYLVRSEWRDAITAGFVVAYLLLLLTSLVPGFGSGEVADDTIRKVLLDNFTVLMGIVVAFYFTAEAAGEVAKSVLGARLATLSAAAPAPPSGR